MNKDDLKQRLISHGSTPEEHASVAIRKLVELLNGWLEDTTAEKQHALMTKCFQAAQDETLAAVSHVIDEVLDEHSRVFAERGYIRSLVVMSDDLRTLAKALRGEG